MPNEETKVTRRAVAGFLDRVISNMIHDEDLRDWAQEEGLDPEEALSALDWWQDKIRRGHKA